MLSGTQRTTRESISPSYLRLGFRCHIYGLTTRQLYCPRVWNQYHISRSAMHWLAFLQAPSILINVALPPQVFKPALPLFLSLNFTLPILTYSHFPYFNVYDRSIAEGRFHYNSTLHRQNRPKHSRGRRHTYKHSIQSHHIHHL